MDININYVLDETMLSWAKNVNKEISKICENEIDFSNSPCRPHITLLMGGVDEDSLPEIRNIVDEFKSQSLDKKIEFTKPYISGNYVFVDVVNMESFVQDCNEILSKLSDKITPHRFLISNGNKAHITLGYPTKPELVKDYIESIKEVPSTTLHEIKLSQKGVHGTVLDFEEQVSDLETDENMM